jgi:hypothetical protein
MWLTNSDRTYGDSTHGVPRVGSRTLMVQEKGAAKLTCFVADVNPEGTFGRVCASALRSMPVSTTSARDKHFTHTKLEVSR